MDIKMFGSFSITNKTDSISDSKNRSKKVWSLIAYLVYHRNRIVKQEELIDLIWGETDKDINPTGALKTLMHRARAELDNLEDGAGKNLIICSAAGYRWNTDMDADIDCDVFDKILSGGQDVSAEDVIYALGLYKGEFLGKMASELWVVPIAAYFHNLFVESIKKYYPMLLDSNHIDDVIEFCRIAISVEPYNEEMHYIAMKAYLANGEQKKAIELYQRFSKRLLSELGVVCSEEIRALYHEAVKTTNLHIISMEVLKDQLKETSDEPGALVCEYDFFKVLYNSMARSVLRNGIAVHIALISAVEDKTEPSPKKLEKVMPGVEEVIRLSLRRGDSAAKCSASQYVIMLPRANYENSCMVCERIIKSYNKKFSYSGITLRFDVCPLEPDDKENFQWIREALNN